jgi:hypothetical protein
MEEQTLTRSKGATSRLWAKKWVRGVEKFSIGGWPKPLGTFGFGVWLQQGSGWTDSLFCSELRCASAVFGRGVREKK